MEKHFDTVYDQIWVMAIVILRRKLRLATHFSVILTYFSDSKIMYTQ